jgi:hypothetical protein
MIVGIVSNLIFRSKLREMLSHNSNNSRIWFPKDLANLQDYINNNYQTVASAVCDLDNSRIDPLLAIKVLKDLSTIQNHTIQIYAFFAHVNSQAKKEAKLLGLKHVYPRSIFFEEVNSLIS